MKWQGGSGRFQNASGTTVWLVQVNPIRHTMLSRMGSLTIENVFLLQADLVANVSTFFVP